MSTQPRKLTTVDIARMAGVAQATVSRVLNGDARVAEDKRRKVLEISARLGYQPNPLARALRGGRTNIIGMIWPSTPWHWMVQRSLAARIEARGCILFPIEATGGDDAILRAAGEMHRRRVDALVAFVPMALDWLPTLREIRQMHAASLMVSYGPLPPEIQPSLVMSCRQAYEDLIVRWCAAGRKRIVYVGNRQSNRRKYDALVAALGSLAPGMELVGHIDLPFLSRTDSYTQATFHHLSACSALMEGADAAVCSNDEVAGATMSWLQDRGRRVGQDVAVVGFDNMSWGRCFRPELASIDHNAVQVIDHLEKGLWALMDADKAGQAAPAEEVTIHSELIWRASAGEAPARVKDAD